MWKVKIGVFGQFVIDEEVNVKKIGQNFIFLIFNLVVFVWYFLFAWYCEIFQNFVRKVFFRIFVSQWFVFCFIKVKIIFRRISQIVLFKVI